MTDLLMVAVALMFFAVAVAYVALCDRVIGPDPIDDDEPALTSTQIDATVTV